MLKGFALARYELGEGAQSKICISLKRLRGTVVYGGISPAMKVRVLCGFCVCAIMLGLTDM
jgi:hypothetical protein